MVMASGASSASRDFSSLSYLQMRLPQGKEKVSEVAGMRFNTRFMVLAAIWLI